MAYFAEPCAAKGQPTKRIFAVCQALSNIWCGLPHRNTRLPIDAQVWYFFSAGSNVFLLPYLYVYFSAAGYTDSQLGLISVFRPWLSALANVLLPPLADRWQCHRLLLMATFTSAVLLRLCLSFAVTNYTFLLFFVLAAEFLGAPPGSVTDAVVVASSAEVRSHPLLCADRLIAVPKADGCRKSHICQDGA